METFNGKKGMKKYSSILAAAVLMLAASCAKEVRVDVPENESAETVEITVVASEKPEPLTLAGTRTFIDGTSVKWSDSGEKIKVFEVATPAEGDVATTSATSAEGVTSDSGATMSFGVTLADKSEGYTSFDYYAVYPSSAYQSHTSVNAVALNTKGAQTPTATNFDASQDLLIAKKIENGASQASTLEMQFARVVAIGKMTIKNLESADPITKITFSAKVGEEAVALAGRTNFNLETAKPVSSYASNTQDHSIILDYEGQSITANTSAGMVAYFTCYPFDLVAGDSFKVVVETATESFTKEVSLTGAQALSFIIGKSSLFSVNMDGITGENKAVDLRYAYLDSEDYVNAGGTNSYSNITVSKTHGDAWETHARSDAGIQINSGYYIKLPDFVEDIKTVIVTLSVAASGKTLSLNTLANGSGTEIASVTTASELSYEFDLSSDSYKTAYVLSDGTIKFSKIEVYAGTDNRTALEAPQNVAAVLNNDDAEVTNSIDVSWDAVAGAGSYLITLMDVNTDITTKVADASPYTVIGLEYDMEYMIAVKAVPADPYINKESAEADAPSNVTTGSEPAGAKYELVSTANDVTEGDYIITWDNTYYLVSGSTSGTNPAVGTGITVADGKISCAVTSDMVWTFTGDNSNGFTISDGTNILHSTNAAQGISINTTSDRKWTVSVDNTYGMLLHGNDGGTRYLAVYNSSSWRYYGTGASYTGKLRLYKYSDPRDPVTLSFTEDLLNYDTDDYGDCTGQVATASPNVSAVTSNIEYALTGDAIGTVNSASGAVTLNGTTGTATITASFAGDGDYKPANASYTITVSNANANDGSLEHPYTASEASALAQNGDTGSYYISGIVTKIQNQYSASYGTANFWIDENGTDQSVFEGYKIKYFGNVNWVESNAQVEVNDEVIIYGTLTMYNTTPETSSGYLVSLNGKTKGLTLAAPTVTTNASAKQITVAWTAATGTESAVSYVINCGTQSYNANAAGSHTFTMADYGTYNVSIEATASDAVSAAISTSATLTDPSAGAPTEYTIEWGSTYNDSSVSSYTASWNATKDGFTVNMQNFNNNSNGWSYVKCGRKNNASVATIITDEAIPEAIKTVTITIDALTASSINSITLYVSSSKTSDWTSAGTFTKATGNQSVTITSPAADKYYKLEFDCASGSSNGLLTLSKAVFSTN